MPWRISAPLLVPPTLQRLRQEPSAQTFAESIAANAVHGSDSDENAAIEGSFYFSERELA